MLVLGRNEGEAVVLVQGGKVLGRIVVSRTQPDRVRLAFDLLREIDIVRAELRPLAGDAEVRAELRESASVAAAGTAIAGGVRHGRV